MPHQTCTVCLHPEKDSIDLALRAGDASLRELAERFGLKKTSLHRHQHHDDSARARLNTGQLERIDAEISKLNRAENRARRKRDMPTCIAIAKEKRNWFVMRERAQAVEIAAQPPEQPEMNRAELVATAQAVIEGDVASGTPETIAWLQELALRVPGTKNEPAEPERIDGES